MEWSNLFERKNLIPIVTLDKEIQLIGTIFWWKFDIRWRWWWERSNYNDLASYVSNRSQNLAAVQLVEMEKQIIH